ncbi:GNAT family N-acetyltransferase [Lacticaseibacillus paracasei]|jgi:[ribosomal protein S5]-alanine N-acetyltransferase|uniref:N-acetyltransferase n=1 Tax=Lacticaseibacillus paracasei subsp. paracasei Lpp49 TaxID=1256213 RepID=A0ABC9TB70_LACPA|nr:hypothetical protein [Lacticaseibacillus paracasei]EPC90427.1 hypothetical protein Lpp49_09812 [Lacticaseibacillus paracasei subsp. paracasei Lpp49]
MMTDVYTTCPTFSSKHFDYRQVTTKDAPDLLQAYSDTKSVPLFNSDNCGGDDFHYTTIERMTNAIDYWQEEYQLRGFVRWSILDQVTNLAIGTVEIFDRNAGDFFDDTAILRLDLRNDFEKKAIIREILTIYMAATPSLFTSAKMATKAPEFATERAAALTEAGFRLSTEKLIGHKGEAYDHYYVYSFARD